VRSTEIQAAESCLQQLNASGPTKPPLPDLSSDVAILKQFGSVSVNYESGENLGSQWSELRLWLEQLDDACKSVLGVTRGLNISSVIARTLYLCLS
jgi:hypothetical protein